MAARNIIVIGASAGGFEALKTLVAGLPENFEASIFIVWHMSPDVRGVLPQVLNRSRTVPAAHAVDGEAIVPNRIYVAPPDRHLLIDGEGRLVRVTRGPKENRFRPAVDPLFRSAAFAFRTRVVGVILSGSLDDGTAGLWTIKRRGGTAVVQEPLDAEVPSMPENALRAVRVDYRVPIAEMAGLLVRLASEEAPETVPEVSVEEDRKTEIEIRIAAEDSAFESGVLSLGVLTPYTCPECHGVLSRLQDGELMRFRCHTGHAYSADSLLATVTENIENSLYDAIRGVEESIMLLNHLGDHLAEINQPKLAAVYFKKAKEAEERARAVRRTVLSHEMLSRDSLRQESE